MILSTALFDGALLPEITPPLMVKLPLTPPPLSVAVLFVMEPPVIVKLPSKTQTPPPFVAVLFVMEPPFIVKEPPFVGVDQLLLTRTPAPYLYEEFSLITPPSMMNTAFVSTTTPPPQLPSGTPGLE